MLSHRDVDRLLRTGEGTEIGASSAGSLSVAWEAMVEERKVIMSERTREEEAEGRGQRRLRSVHLRIGGLAT